MRTATARLRTAALALLAGLLVPLSSAAQWGARGGGSTAGGASYRMGAAGSSAGMRGSPSRTSDAVGRDLRASIARSGAGTGAGRAVASGTGGAARSSSTTAATAARQRVADRLFTSRREAFRAIRQDLGIPRGQHPLRVERVPMTDRHGDRVVRNGRPVETREYHFRTPSGRVIVVQDHAAGHQFGQGGRGDQGAHFNVRPADNTRTGSVPGAAPHYEFPARGR